MKITDRERELLKWFVFLASLLLIYYFALRILNEQRVALELQRDGLIQEKLIVEQTLPQYNDIKKVRKDTQLLVQDQFDKFVDVYTSDAFEAYLLPLLIENNADILYYQASPMMVVNPETLHHPQEVFNYKLKTLIDAYNQSSQTETLVSSGSELLKTTVLYELGLSYPDYLNLVDALHDLKLSILLTKSEYQFEDSRASLSLDVYSMHKLDFNQE
jgi:hypothetical protein